MDVDGRPTYLGPRFESYFSVSIESLNQRGWLCIVVAADRARLLRAWRQTVTSGHKVEVEVRLRRFDGALRWFAVRLVPVRNEAGALCATVGGCTDIHDLKRSQQELKRSNSELKQFAYAAAHDLQEPLRNVATCLGMLKRGHADQLDASANEWIDASIEGAQRIHEMVKDLLMFSTIIDARSEQRCYANGSAALQTALQNLDTIVTNIAPKFEVSEIPDLAVEEQHLVHLFQHLLSNALKYRRPCVPCTISVSASIFGGDCRICVRDNGIGFDPVYATAIFRVFKRLHSRASYPGNGIGLAICERIVSHYAGRIWAESTPGEGSAFYFTLPAAGECK